MGRLKKHGMSRTPTYRSWESMKGRCGDPKRKSYVGVDYWEGWEDFLKFLTDMGERPSGTTLDRIKNTEGYFPGNCRWATRKVQQRNRNMSRLVEWRGEVKCAAEWAEKFNVDQRQLRLFAKLHGYAAALERAELGLFGTRKHWRG